VKKRFVSFVLCCRAVSTVCRCHHLSRISATDCSGRCTARLQVLYAFPYCYMYL